LGAVSEEVKTGARDPAKRGLSRHFEGYELALLVVGLVACVALLVVPRATEPDVLPTPRVDHAEARHLAELDAQRAKQAESKALPYEVRGVGEAFRAFGLAGAAKNALAMSDKLRVLRRTTAEARQAHGDEPLLRLESIQTELFVQALARWESGADTKREIEELGGDFLDKRRWSNERRFLMSETERRTLFRVRWVDLLGLRTVSPFVPSANEWRIYYGFLLEHPEHAEAHARAEEQLSYVAAVERVDLTFPGLFARGVLYYRLGNYDRSAEAFRGHLSRNPTGPWRLRAQNHLALSAKRALERAAASGLEIVDP
jgi:hypothetical protein